MRFHILAAIMAAAMAMPRAVSAAQAGCSDTSGALILEKIRLNATGPQFVGCINRTFDKLSSSSALSGSGTTNYMAILYVATIGGLPTSGGVNFSSNVVMGSDLTISLSGPVGYFTSESSVTASAFFGLHVGDVVGNVTGASSLNVLKAGDIMTGQLTMDGTDLKVSSGTLEIDGDAAISFRINGSTLVALSNGFIGIGTSNPQAALHLSGGSAAAEITLDNTDANGRQWRILSSVDGGLVFRDQDVTTTRLKISTLGYVGIQNNTPSQRFHVGVATLVVNTDLGFVGIGTNQPTEVLFVQGNSTFTGILTALAFDTSGSYYALNGSTFARNDGSFNLGPAGIKSTFTATGSLLMHPAGAGFITSVSSINASAFFGDGGSLVNIGAAGSANVTIDAKVDEAGGVTIGQCLYQNGVSGQTPTVGLCDNTDPAKFEAIGLAGQTRSDGQTILVIIAGQILGVDADGTGAPGVSESWSDADDLYMITSGNLSDTLPTNGFVRHIAKVAYAHGTNGKLLTASHPEPYSSTPAGVDYDIRTGDTIGVNKISFEDYNDVEIGWINSNGEQGWFPNQTGASTMTVAALSLGFNTNLDLTGPTAYANFPSSVTASAFFGPLTGEAATAAAAAAAGSVAGSGAIALGVDTSWNAILGEVDASAVDDSTNPVQSDALFEHNDGVNHANGISGEAATAAAAASAGSVAGSGAFAIGVDTSWNAILGEVDASAVDDSTNPVQSDALFEHNDGVTHANGISGEAATAAAAASAGSVAGSGAFAIGVDTSWNAVLGEVDASAVDDSTNPVQSDALFEHNAGVTHANGISGEAATAAAAAAAGSVAGSGAFAIGVDTSWNAILGEVDASEVDDSTNPVQSDALFEHNDGVNHANGISGEAATAAAAAAAGSVAGSGAFAIGVDTSWNAVLGEVDASEVDDSTNPVQSDALFEHAALTGDSAHGAKSDGTVSQIVTLDGSGDFSANDVSVAELTSSDNAGSGVVCAQFDNGGILGKAAGACGAGDGDTNAASEEDISARWTFLDGLFAYTTTYIGLEPWAGTAEATGGDITYSGGWTIHTFTESGTFEPDGTMDVDWVLVGGGGGGCLGGGAGGGYLENDDEPLTAQAYTVTVSTGADGCAASNGGLPGDIASPSVFGSTIAFGGGGGGCYNTSCAVPGGGGGWNTNFASCAGVGSPVQIYAGGAGLGGSGAGDAGGGGGGAGEAGANQAAGGAGGDGRASAITGANTYYGGGGGGGDNVSGGPNAGGAGGGGDGGGGGVGDNGTDELGGGGGGGRYTSGGGDGGSGVFIVRYRTPGAIISGVYVGYTGTVGIGTSAPESALGVSGAISQSEVVSCATGLTSDGDGIINGCVASSRHLKKNVITASVELDVISLLHPVEYKFKGNKYGSGLRTGFIADEVRRVFPSAVAPAGRGTWGVDPNAINALLIKEAQATRQRLADIEDRLDALEAKPPEHTHEVPPE